MADLPELRAESEKQIYSDGEDVPSLDKDSDKKGELEDDVLPSEGRRDAPIIHDGTDVSRYIVDVRDDGDTPITVRAVVIGTIMAGLGAALQQLYTFKPVSANISGVFLLLVVYTFGTAWAALLPRKTLVEGTRFASIAPILYVLNPSDFGIKEHVVATVMASTAAWGNTAVTNFAVQRLFYDTNVHATTAVLAAFSTSCFGYGIVGILRPLTIWPAEMVYWRQLPTVSVFQGLHFHTESNKKRIRTFWIVFAVLFCYEIFPSYIFPLLNGFSIICLATQGAPSGARDAITNIFGGAEANEGMGFLNLSFDWQYITSEKMSLPLIQQANAWVGYAISYVAIASIYYTNTWNAKSFPMLSTSLFFQNGTKYKQSVIFTPPHFEVNRTALAQYGLPALTGSNAWYNLSDNMAIGGLIAHCCCFWGPYILQSFRHARDKTYPDPHWKAMQKYKEAPHYWYHLLLLLAFFAGLIVVLKGETTLPWWSYIAALLTGTIITPFSMLMYGRFGGAVTTTQLPKMIAGAITPGRPVANLYFSMWSHDVVSNSIEMATDLKLGQYTKIPPRIMFAVQVWGTILGAIVNYVVMVSVVTSQRDVLLEPSGTNIWSGQYVQSRNSDAVTWALAKDLYGPHGKYFVIPMGIFIGAVPTIIQWLISLRWPNLKIGLVSISSVVLPLIWQYSGYMYAGVTSVYTTMVIVGLTSQLWWRRYHPRSYRKYNYIVGGAMDGGAQIMIFILSFAVFGAAGTERRFPAWAGNPAKGNVDYCNGNGALK